jgi:hypothetical protein
MTCRTYNDAIRVLREAAKKAALHPEWLERQKEMSYIHAITALQEARKQ